MTVETVDIVFSSTYVYSEESILSWTTMKYWDKLVISHNQT